MIELLPIPYRGVIMNPVSKRHDPAIVLVDYECVGGPRDGGEWSTTKHDIICVEVAVNGVIVGAYWPDHGTPNRPTLRYLHKLSPASEEATR